MGGDRGEFSISVWVQGINEDMKLFVFLSGYVWLTVILLNVVPENIYIPPPPWRVMEFPRGREV